jgi:hypothetical protein
MITGIRTAAAYAVYETNSEKEIDTGHSAVGKVVLWYCVNWI